MGPVAGPDWRGVRIPDLGGHCGHLDRRGGAEVKTTKVALSGEKRDAKQMLDAVVKFLNVEDEESTMLWNILTALRGPDSEDFRLKLDTTARLRHAIGLRSYTGKHQGYFMTNDRPLRSYSVTPSHFGNHFNWAVEALGNIQTRHAKRTQDDINAELNSGASVFDSLVDRAIDSYTRPVRRKR